MKKFRQLRKELVNYQTEGTWALPDNPRAKKELKALMAKPLILGKEGDEAADKLYNIIGDDELFDDLFVAGKKNPKGDARPLIKKAMKRLKIKEDVENAVEYARTINEVTIGKMVPKHAIKNMGKDQKTFSAYIKRKTGKDVYFDDDDLIVGKKRAIKGALTNDNMTTDQMVAKVKAFKEEFAEDIDEGIKHDRYMRTHGKKAPAKEVGTWMFTTKEMGDVDYDNEKVVWRAKRPMKLAQAGKEAMKALGTKDVYVMEGVTEKKKETVKDFLKRGGKITKVKGGTGKAGRAAMDKFKKSYGKMKDKEAEKDQEVNELSKKTYKSYIAKAKKSQKELEKQHRKAHDDACPAHSMPYGDWKKQKMSGDKARDKAINRRYMQRIAKSKIDPTFDPRTDAKKAWDASQGGKDPQLWKKHKKTATRLGSTRNAESTEFNEATDIFNKGGIHVTRFAMGGGKLGFQFNFGKVGRYIQIPLEKLSVLDQAVKMAKKAGKTGKQGNLPIADDVNEKTDRWYEDQPEWGTPESTEHAKRMTPGEYAESTAEYAKSLEKIARDRQLAAISDKDKQTLMKIAAMLAKEKKK